MVSQKHCNEPKNGFGGENGGWCIGDALMDHDNTFEPQKIWPLVDEISKKKKTNNRDQALVALRQYIFYLPHKELNGKQTENLIIEI